MRRFALVGCIAAAGLLAAAALAVRALPGESWIGSQYGWTATPPSNCKPRRDVCSTENGGATWHGIFNGGTYVFGVVRTSSTAGVVSTGRQAAARFWTRDNGRHWYRSARIGPEFQGSGSLLFWIDSGATLHRVRPWPPTAPARCRGTWSGAAFVTAPGRNVCNGPAVEAGMRSSDAVTLEEGKLAGLSNVPGGVIVTVSSSPVPRILFYRRGTPRVVDLPNTGMVPCAGFNREPIVTWPRITVLGCTTPAGDVSGVWVSNDGGLKWQAIRG
jgi:hypothetical protein